MDMQLEGKRALVTGGSRGIGKAVARAVAQEGADVALLARSADALHAAVIELASQTWRKVVGVLGDIANDDWVRQAVADAVSALGGGIDILVNAAAEPAGFAGPPKLAAITGTYFHGELDTKVHGLHPLRARGRRRHEGLGLGAHRQHQRIVRAPDRQHGRQHPQRRGGGTDQEHGRRVRPAKHQCH